MAGFDYIIVGVGLAGSVFASHLSAKSKNEAAILEAGGRDQDPWVRIPTRIN